MKKNKQKNYKGEFITMTCLFLGLLGICAKTAYIPPPNISEHKFERMYCKHIPKGWLRGEAASVLLIKTDTGFVSSSAADCNFDSTGTIKRTSELPEDVKDYFRAES